MSESDVESVYIADYKYKDTLANATKLTTNKEKKSKNL